MAGSGCEIPRRGHIRCPPPERRKTLSDCLSKEVAMRTNLMSRLGRASAVVAIAGLAIAAVGTSAEAREWNHGWHGGGWNHAWHGAYYNHWRGNYWGPRYAAPVYA